MKPLSLASALFGLLATSAAAANSSPSAAGSRSKVTLPAEFKPPQVFKNANLVHIVSLEKNYVKEQVNVLIENVSKQPQDEYYLPFTADQMSRVGGFEVKDRKDTTAGPFVAERVEYDPNRCGCFRVCYASSSLLTIDFQRRSVLSHPAPRAAKGRRPADP